MSEEKPRFDSPGVSGPPPDRRGNTEPNANKNVPAIFKNWLPEKGYGFLFLEDGREVYCHIDELCDHLRPQRGKMPERRSKLIVGNVQETQKGSRASDVKCPECAIPPQWELQAVGEELFGAREYKTMCVKGNSNSHCPITYEQIKEANAPYREAKKKKDLWEVSYLLDNFFDVFGEPDSVKAETEEQIVLVYPFGRKTISAESAYSSRHWETIPSGFWMNKTIGNNEYIKAEFTFTDIPKAKALIDVGYCGSLKGTVATLYKDFDKLPPNVQEEIITETKKTIPSSESCAENKWQDFLEDSYSQKKISEWRQQIIELQSPGEMDLDSSKGRETIHYGESDDGYISAGSYEKDVIRKFIITGARRIENSDNKRGGHKFEIYGSTIEINKANLEKIRDEMVDYTINMMMQTINVATDKKIPELDPRLYDISPEDWIQHYQEKIKTLSQKTLDEWRLEDEAKLKKLNEENDEYNAISNKVREIRDAVNRFNERAKKNRIYLTDSDLPDVGHCRIGESEIKEMLECVDQTKIYLEAAEKYMAKTLAERGEQELTIFKTQEEAVQNIKEAMEKPATPAPWYLDGIDPMTVKETFGRNPGEGFGNRIAGKNALYLPGDKPLVGVSIYKGGGGRYKVEVITTGLSTIKDSLPKTPDGNKLVLGLVENPNWSVKVEYYKDNKIDAYGLINSKGISILYPNEGEREDEVSSRLWDGTKGDGPTATEIRATHNLAPISKPGYKKSNERPQSSQEKTLPSEQKETIVTFAYIGKRDFKCDSCQGFGQITGSEKKSYDEGNEVEVVCGKCQGKGKVKK